MRIVGATRAHVPAVAALMASSPLLRPYGVTARAARASLGEAVRSGDVLLVALDDRAVVGLAWSIRTRALDRAAYLRLLLVAAGRQSRGIGSALLLRTEHGARAAGCRHVILLVTASNRRARTFYARNGYRHVANLPAFVRPRIVESLYAKRLGARARRVPR